MKKRIQKVHEEENTKGTWKREYKRYPKKRVQKVPEEESTKGTWRRLASMYKLSIAVCIVEGIIISRVPVGNLLSLS